MKFLVDANLGRKFTTHLQNAGHDTIFAKDLYPLTADEEILAKQEGKIRIRALK